MREFGEVDGIWNNEIVKVSTLMMLKLPLRKPETLMRQLKKIKDPNLLTIVVFRRPALSVGFLVKLTLAES